MEMKAMPANAFNSTQDFKVSLYFETLPPGIDFEDLFQPRFWFHHQNRFNLFDQIRIRASDGAFDVYLTVSKILPGGVRMEYLGGRAPAGLESFKEIEQAAKRMSQNKKIVPMDKAGNPIPRLDYSEITKWRVIGLDNNEIARGFDSKAEGQAHLASYLDDLNLRLPSPEEREEHLASQPSPASAYQRPATTKRKARA